MGRRRTVAVLCGVLCAVWLLCGAWFWETPVKVQSTRILMSTSVNVQIYIKDKDRGEDLIQRAFDEAQRIERIMEPLKGGGEVNLLNTGPRGDWMHVGPELADVFAASFTYYRLSDGAFDPTIAPVKWLWDFEGDGHVPPREDVRELLPHVGLDHVEMRGDSIRIDDPETKLDFGGVAKGYIVDRMMDILRDGGASAILVNAGGDISFEGRKPNGDDWMIGLRHPRRSRTYIIDGNPFSCVATSGDYERFFVEDGVRYHHILDPATGFPARGAVSVTVWTTTAMEADILSTTFFVLGPEKGVALAESLDRVETLIFYEKDGVIEAAMSSGIKGRVRL